MWLVTGFLVLHNLGFGNGEYFSENGFLTRHENEWIQAVCGHRPGRKPAGHKSLNSEFVSITDAPWTVTVFDDKARLACSASLISNRHVLTAAHCFQRNSKKVDFDNEAWPNPIKRPMIVMETASPNNLRVVLGDDCAKSSYACTENASGTRQEIKVRRFWVRETYNINKTLDIAILELESNVKFNRNIMHVCLGDGPLAMGQHLHIYGSGYDGVSAKGFYKLQHISVKVAHCSLKTTALHEIPPDTKLFCTISENMERKQATCPGDSGSGVVDGPDENDKMHIHGVVSGGSGACEAGSERTNLSDLSYVDHLTYIRPLINWIARKTGVCPTGHSCETEPRYLESDADGYMIEVGKTRTLYCDDDTWLLSSDGSNAICYKIASWTDGKVNVTGAEKKCEKMFMADLAPVRNEKELLALRFALPKSGYKVDGKSKTFIPVGGFWNARANQFKWNMDRSLALRDGVNIHLWAPGTGKSTDMNGRETHCMAARYRYDVPLLTEISCDYETDVAACAKAPGSRLKASNTNSRRIN